MENTISCGVCVCNRQYIGCFGASPLTDSTYDYRALKASGFRSFGQPTARSGFIGAINDANYQGSNSADSQITRKALTVSVSFSGTPNGVFDDGFREVHFGGIDSRWLIPIFFRHSLPTRASAANSGHRATAARTSSMIVLARPRFIRADFAQASKSSLVKPSRLPLSVIWWVAVHEPEGL